MKKDKSVKTNPGLMQQLSGDYKKEPYLMTKEKLEETIKSFFSSTTAYTSPTIGVVTGRGGIKLMEDAFMAGSS